MKLSASILCLAFLAMPAVVSAADRSVNGLRGVVTDGDGDGTDFARRLANESHAEIKRIDPSSPWTDPLCADFVQSLKTGEEELVAGDEEDIAASACSSTGREKSMEFLKYIEGIDYVKLPDCQAANLHRNVR